MIKLGPLSTAPDWRRYDAQSEPGAPHRYNPHAPPVDDGNVDHGKSAITNAKQVVLETSLALLPDMSVLMPYAAMDGAKMEAFAFGVFADVLQLGSLPFRLGKNVADTVTHAAAAGIEAVIERNPLKLRD